MKMIAVPAQDALAERIARREHKGQKRKDGTPYISHPRRMVEKIEKEESSNDHHIKGSFFWAGWYRNLRAVAWLHDVIEDTDMNLHFLKLSDVEENIIAAVEAITKRQGEQYLDYLSRVTANDLATAVKIYDLRDNLRNLEKGNLRDKYELTLWLLENDAQEGGLQVLFRHCTLTEALESRSDEI